jgi:TfoX/Sxy family transcriptional regulator of competence genes
MPSNEKTAERVRVLVKRRKGVSEKKMFGGVGFLLDGNMCVGVWKESLILRIGPNAYEEALEQPFTKEFDITGRAMTGWVMVSPEGFAEEDELKSWIEAAVKFVRTLPVKA